MMKNCILGAVLAFGAVSAANASLSFIDENGNAVTAPSVIDPTMEAVYFGEFVNYASSYGYYDVTNNTADYYLVAFGISNTGTTAWVGSPGSTFGCAGSWCYEASNLNADNWATDTIDPSWSLTGQDIFGDIANVLDPGDDTLNFYRAADGDLGPGDSWDGFLFTGPGLGSQMFVVLSGPSGTIYASGGQPVSAVPVPAAAWLMVSGLVGLAGVARRRNST